MRKASRSPPKHELSVFVLISPRDHQSPDWIKRTNTPHASPYVRKKKLFCGQKWNL